MFQFLILRPSLLFPHLFQLRRVCRLPDVQLLEVVVPVVPWPVADTTTVNVQTEYGLCVNVRMVLLVFHLEGACIAIGRRTESSPIVDRQRSRETPRTMGLHLLEAMTRLRLLPRQPRSPSRLPRSPPRRPRSLLKQLRSLQIPLRSAPNQALE